MFPSLYGSGEDCIVFNDPSTGVRGIPNCVVREKTFETEVTEYRFNSCGYRAGMECGPKPQGAYRIVMIGTSMAMGMRAPREETFAALLPAELSRRTGRKIQLYNESMPWRPPHIVALHFNEVLAAEPDMILWILTPADVLNSLPGRRAPSELPQPQGLSAYRQVRRSLKAALTRVAAHLYDHSGFLLRHFLYESQIQSINAYLAQKPDAPDMPQVRGPEFLKVAPSAAWQGRLKSFGSDAVEILAQARAAGVPVVAALLPERAQAAMISRGEWPAGFDPYKLDNELRSLFASHGGAYVDILPALRNVPNAEQGFYPIDSHPNSQGHAMISGLLAKELTNGAAPPLGVSAVKKTVLEQGR
jgi:hypothetical protein